MGRTRKTPKTIKTPKQLTLDNLPNAPNKESNKATTNPTHEKQIIITQIDSAPREDELALKIGFKLLPSKTTFSKVKSDLWFDNRQISSISISIPQSALATNEFELTSVLDMKGIAPGTHIIKVEMYEPWASGEKLSCTAKAVTVEYVPQTRESRLVKIPIVRSVAGTDLVIVSESDKNMYREIEETMKKETISKRDDW